MKTKELCQHCHKNPATLDWIGEGSLMDWNHGNYERWCSDCADSEQTKYWLKQTKDKLMKDFGKPCKQFCYGCPVCMVWLAYSILENSYL